MLKILYIVSLSYLVIAADAGRCKPDYIFNNNARGWLKLHRIPATWEEAFLRCRNEGAVLASPLNKELVKALVSQLDGLSVYESIFLGTHDLYSKGHFASVEGVPLSDMEIEELHGSPESTAHCLTMSIQGPSYYMHTSSCNEPLLFICYRKFGNETMNECGTFDDEYHFEQHTGSCYKVHHKIQTWTRAYGICASEGGYLVILNDKEEARIVKDMFPDRQENELWDRFHVGLVAWMNRNDPGRIWTTIHGESFEDTFSEWNDDQPNNLGNIQDRASFVREGALDDIDPEFIAMFVCEKSPTSIQFEIPQLGREELLGMQEDSFKKKYCNQI